MNKFFRREEIAERAKKAVLIGITLLILVSIMTVSTACFFDFGDYEDDGKRYQIGEAAVTGSTQVTVNKVFQTKKIGSYSTNYYFVTLEVTIKNLGTEEEIYVSSDFELCNGALTYEPHNSGGSVDGGFWMSLSLGPGLSTTEYFVFEIPTSYVEDDYYLEVQDGYSEPVRIALPKTLPEEDTTRHNIGEAITIGEMTVTVNSYYETDKIGFDTTDDLFLVLRATIFNESNATRHYDPDDFCLKAGKDPYEHDYGTGLNFDNGAGLMFEVQPKSSEVITFVYEVPTSAAYRDYYFEFGMVDIGYVGKIYLRKI